MAVVEAEELEELRRVVALARRPEAAGPLVPWVIHDFQVAALPSATANDLVAPSVAACHADDAPFCDPSLDGRIATAEFGEGLLQEHGPNLTAMRPCILGLRHAVSVTANAVGRAAVPLAGHEVVDDDGLPLACLRVKKPNRVLAPGVDLGRQKEGADGALVLRERGNGSEEPAIAQGALQDILGLYLALEQTHVRVVQVRVRSLHGCVGL
mmetsp:Transcript_119065/g.297072  ORF Transcript_119065/g.297072 Transcript_119065/m.297072 type:complete len:211 (+) Transcript_119065:514-1146(+)